MANSLQNASKSMICTDSGCDMGRVYFAIKTNNNEWGANITDLMQIGSKFITIFKAIS